MYRYVQNIYYRKVQVSGNGCLTLHSQFRTIYMHEMGTYYCRKVGICYVLLRLLWFMMCVEPNADFVEYG